MKIFIDGKQYESPTAVGLIEKIKEIRWNTTAILDADSYIDCQQEMYKLVTGHTLKLPNGDTETRAVAMFEKIDEIGAWTFEKGDNTMNKERRYYFAYGSNCNLRQMAVRCPRAARIGAVTLRNYTLGFNGRNNGDGVATIRRKNGAEVKGVLWAITANCEKVLDRYEGYPYLYGKNTVTVYKEDGEAIRAMVYVMTAEYDYPSMPSKNYYDGISEGFTENGIPLDTLRFALTDTDNRIKKMEGKRNEQ